MPVPPQNVWRPRPREKDAQQHKYSARVWDNNMNPLNLQQLSMLSFMRMPPGAASWLVRDVGNIQYVTSRILPAPYKRYIHGQCSGGAERSRPQQRRRSIMQTVPVSWARD